MQYPYFVNIRSIYEKRAINTSTSRLQRHFSIALATWISLILRIDCYQLEKRIYCPLSFSLYSISMQAIMPYRRCELTQLFFWMPYRLVYERYLIYLPVYIYIYIRYKPYINLVCFNAIKILIGIFINQVLFTENNLSNEHKMQTWTRDVAYYLQVTEYNIMFAYILPFFVWRAAQQIVLCLKRIDVWRLYSRLSH